MLLLLLSAGAQKRYNVWAFGVEGGIDFNTDPVTPFKSKSEGDRPPYYTASICDKNGTLMFYTDGAKVWNRDHYVLPKYRNWWPWAGKIIPLICPYPSNDSLYYIFGVSNQARPYQLQYITTKMYNAGDIEEVIYPRPATQASNATTMQQNASVLLAGTTHCNEHDVWIVSHTAGALNAFLVTDAGVSTTPVVTPVAASLLRPDTINGYKSNIKFSANGEKFVIPSHDEGKVVVFDFDNLSGKFSNPVCVNVPPRKELDDFELSPDGSKLYVGSKLDTMQSDVPYKIHSIYQYDLDAGTEAAVAATQSLVSPPDQVVCFRTCYELHRTLQLGPDGKIYVSMRYVSDQPFDMTITVIENPNKTGLAMRYRRNLVNLKRKYKFINYNYIRSGSYSLRENGILFQKKTCADKPVDFSLLFSNVDSVKWNFGDPGSGSNNFSTALAPQHRYPAPGTYAAFAVVYNRCLVDTAFAKVVVQQDEAVHIPAVLKDTALCIGSQLTINATTPFARYYTWDNGLIFPTRTITEEGHYALTVENDCSVDTGSFNVVYRECPCEVYMPSGFTPNRDGVNDLFRPIFKCGATDFQMKIFHRYGGVVYETGQLNGGWNGKQGNRDLPTGVYVWIIEYRNPSTRELIRRNGTVTLIH